MKRRTSEYISAHKKEGRKPFSVRFNAAAAACLRLPVPASQKTSSPNNYWGQDQKGKKRKREEREENL